MVFNWIKRKKNDLPKTLENHEFLDSILLSAKRPVNINEIQKSLEAKIEKVDFLINAEFVLRCLNKENLWQASAANLFVACLRSYCDFRGGSQQIRKTNLREGLNFGKKMITEIPDSRAIKSLVTYHHRNNDYLEAFGLLSILREDEWTKNKRKIIERSLPSYQKKKQTKNIANSFNTSLLKHIGYENLSNTHHSAILLYGNIDMNVIDGSSIWLASIAEVLSECGLKVHFLLKHNISRSILIEKLKAKEDILFIEPKKFDVYGRGMNPNEASNAIEILDGTYGGYKKIILRGMEVCTICASKSSLWNRIWAYLTDFYTIEKENGLVIDEEICEILKDAKFVFDRFLVQTKEIANFMENKIGITKNKILELPPMLPDNIVEIKKTKTPKNNDSIKIGYAGKIAPQWGVMELIECGKKLIKKGYNVEINIIGDKIHRSTPELPNFREESEEILETTPFVNWHKGMSRERTIGLMGNMDLAWCYRDPTLELHTMELSTKLLENISMNLPFIATKNKINSRLLGDDYPLFVDNAKQLEKLMENFISKKIEISFDDDKHTKIIQKHTISDIRKNLVKPLLNKGKTESGNKKNIVIAGHDLKFIGEFESYLKQKGYQVKRDLWEWGEPGDETRSEYLAKWADIVFCEWGLANAVWYSQNLDKDKRLVVRIHLQEINERARRFPPKINMENVDATLFVAKHVKERAMEMFDWQNPGLYVIPNYVNTERLNVPKVKEATKQIGILGVVPMRKRMDRALKLLELIRKNDSEFKLSIKGRLPKDYPWMLAGRKEELEYYEKQFGQIENNPNLSENVSFEGYTNTISEWYAKVGFVLSPSDFESFHYTIADGVASGALPIIWPWEGSDDIYPSEWIVDNTKDAVKRVIKYSNASSKEIEASIDRNHNYIVSSFGMEKVFDELEILTTQRVDIADNLVLESKDILLNAKLNSGKSYILSGNIESKKDEKERSALIKFTFDKNEINVDPVKHKMGFSDNVGAYIYLPTAKGGGKFSKMINVPENGNVDKITIQKWNKCKNDIIIKRMKILPLKNKLVYEPFSKLSISHNNVINLAPAKNSYIYKYINKNKGAYEPETMATICALIEYNCDSFFDIGANIGLYSAIISTIFQDKVEIHAFEPAPDLNKIATEIAQLNSINYRCHDIALSDKKGTADFYLSPVTDTSHSLNPDFRKSKNKISVELNTLNEFCKEKGCWPDLLKIDTETTEFSVLSGGDKLIEGKRPWIVCEVLDGGGKEIEDLLNKYDYHFYHIKESGLQKEAKIIGCSDYRDWLFAPSKIPKKLFSNIDMWKAYLYSGFMN